MFFLFGLLLTLAIGLWRMFQAHIDHMYDPYGRDGALVFWQLFVILSTIGWLSFFYTWRLMWI